MYKDVPVAALRRCAKSRCLDKSYRNEKLLSAAKQIVMHEDVPVAALRRCVKSRWLDISDRFEKS